MTGQTMVKRKERAIVNSQTKLADGVFSMWMETKNIASQVQPGQFVSLYTRDGARLLPRPISICETDRENGRIRIVYRVVGEGTAEFSGCQEGDFVEVLGPLGNGFPLEAAKGKKDICLIGGGIGIPPMLELAKALKEEDGNIRVVLGYRDQLFLKEEFLPYGEVFVATEDGRNGTKGTVSDAIREQAVRADLVFACGPAPMLKALKAWAAENQIECYLSLEERMACGIGACLACVCKTPDVDSHSMVKNRRICKEGPVFEAGEVEL